MPITSYMGCSSLTTSSSAEKQSWQQASRQVVPLTCPVPSLLLTASLFGTHLLGTAAAESGAELQTFHCSPEALAACSTSCSNKSGLLPGPHTEKCGMCPDRCTCRKQGTAGFGLLGIGLAASAVATMQGAARAKKAF